MRQQGPSRWRAPAARPAPDEKQMMHTTQFGSAVFTRVDQLHMSRSKRLRVQAYVHDGEVIAEFLCRAQAGVRSLGRAIGASFARRAGH